MEDALAHAFNPKQEISWNVLILVVMADALAPLEQEQALQRDWQVLILVVMEDALAPQNLGYALFKRIVRLVCAS